MARKQVKPDPTRPTRREFLGVAAAGLGALAWGEPPGAATQPAPASAPATQPGARTPWWLGPEYPRSKVVEIRSSAVISAQQIDEVILGEMISKAVRVLTSAPDDASAWRAILGDARRILVKFNQVGQQALGTTDAMARALVKSLITAGYAPDQLALAEVPDYITRSLGTQEVRDSWGRPIPVGGEPVDVAEYVYEADAIINVPFLKTHRIAGMSGAMKNLAYAIIRHPGRFHGGGCSPYVAEVLAHPEVHGRLRLNVVNALRTVLTDGAEAEGGVIHAHGGLLVGFDPVGVDAVGYELLLSQRRERSVGEVFYVRYLDAGAVLGVGRRALHDLERVPLTHLS